jgi:hypothetical protein
VSPELVVDAAELIAAYIAAGEPEINRADLAPSTPLANGPQRWEPDEAISLEGAVKLGRHGGDRRSEEARDQGGNTTLKPEEKNTVKHTLARLRRDRPDLAGRVEDGEISANAAAIEAGFRRKLTPMQIIEPPLA